MSSDTITISINGDKTQLEQTLISAEQSLQKFSNAAEKVADKMGGISSDAAKFSVVFMGIESAFSSCSSAISALIGSYVEFGGQLSKTSQRIGMSVESLGGLKYAAEQCGSNFEERFIRNCAPGVVEKRHGI